MVDPFDMSDMGAMLQQLGAMMQRAEQVPEGSVDWATVRQSARAAIAQSPDPSTVGAERDRVQAANSLAQMWLDGATDFPAPSLSSAAWSRSEWLEATFTGWQPYLEPIAQSMQRSAGDALSAQQLPEEMAAVMGPMMRVVRQLSALMSAQQVGQALGALARDAWSTSDVGLPLTTDGMAALVTSNTRAFAEEMHLDLRDFETYVMLREAAALRLFASAPWIAARLRDAVAEYASGLRVDTDAVRAMLDDVDPMNPEALQQAMATGMPMVTGSPAALARIELLFTLVEGWIDHVVDVAHAGRIGNAAVIREALRRRRATGGPAERALSQLLGLELKPRLLREAAEFWSTQDPSTRDARWQHPDFLPESLD